MEEKKDNIEVTPTVDVDKDVLLKQAFEVFQSSNSGAKSFKSFDDMLEKHNKIVGVYTDTVNKQKQAEKEKEEFDSLYEKQQEAINKHFDSYIKSDFNLSEEAIKDLKSTGLSDSEIKLKSYEIKEQVNQLYSVAGGKENYEKARDWFINNGSDADKEAYTAVLADMKVNKFAVKGLMAHYAEKSKDSGSKSRIEGQQDNGNNGGVEPFKSKSEFLKEQAYVSSDAGKNDKTRVEMFRKRMGVTNPSVYMV